MANKKFLDTSGVRRLWNNVISAINKAVNVEAERAKLEEKRIEELIAETANNVYIEGNGINITIDENGKKVISLEENAISDEHIEQISISKVTIPEDEVLVLNGGSIDE